MRERLVSKKNKELNKRVQYIFFAVIGVVITVGVYLLISKE